MIYEYECSSCGETTEGIYSIAERPWQIDCPVCGNPAVKIMSLPAIHGEEPTWIDDDLNKALRGPSDPPIESRTDYKKFLDSHPEITPV